jgi:CRP-like cAMP-binding protein
MLPDPFHRLPSSSLTIRTVDRNAVIARMDDPAAAMFYLKSGRIDMCRYTRHGDEIVIHRARAGETFAEAAIFSDRYHCDMVAAQNSEFVSISKAAVLQMMSGNPDFTIAVTARFARQIQDYRRRLEILAIRDASSRVFAGIADGLLFKDIKGFAAQIGLSHEAVYRALATLTRQGRLVKAGRGAYGLPDA